MPGIEGARNLCGLFTVDIITFMSVMKIVKKPDVSKLQDGQVWAAAATQIFYSISISFGGLMTMASYNPFHNNILRDTFIVTLGNCFSSVFAGFAVFSFLGHLGNS